MSNKMLIDATHAEETRVVVVDGNKVEEFDFESENKRQLAGNIYLAKVTRVEPSLQAAFVDYAGNRHGFLAFSEIHPDYYQIPVADREALIAEEMAQAKADAEEEEKPKRRRRSRAKPKSKTKAEEVKSDDEVVTADAPAGEEADADANPEGEAEADAQNVAEDSAEATEDAQPTAEADAKDIPGMDVVELDSHDEDEAEAPYVAADTASEKDETIESVADDDTAEEIRPRRKQRARRYKIQEVIKVRQILLVQVVKEERGNKGAALTTYLSLAGRYCVLMPNTARGGGISRKITNAPDRKKLKEIANEIEVPQGAGLIIRTAGAKRTKTEIKRDYEYLQRLWEQIRALTLQSIAPAKIYEEGNLIKRSIRDLYNRDIDEVLVEGELGYRTAKDFMKMIMPSHAKNVKHYNEPMPLFARHQVESYLAGMFNPTVQLKSGGYIVIGITEALVAIDVNSGKATKEGSIEDTALKTNLEAAEEVARQLRLRDLAGLIVIDFIDMEERKNNSAVEKRFKDRLKTDRARIQVGRISGFGLMEMSRQRLRPGMLEASTQPCPACHGTGLIRSEDSLGLTILRQLEEEGVRRRTKEVLVKAPISIINFLMNMKREHIAQIEARYGMAIRLEADQFLVSPDFSIEKFKTATRRVEAAPVVSVDASLMAEVDEDVAEEEEAIVEETSEEDKPKRKRRRRRRRRGKGGGDNQDNGHQAQDGEEQGANVEETASDAKAEDDAPTAEEPAKDAAEAKADKPKRTRTRRKKSDTSTEKKPEEDQVSEAKQPSDSDAQEPKAEDQSPAAAKDEKPEPAPEKPKRRRAPRKKAEPVAADTAGDVAIAEPKETTPEPAPELAPEPAPEPALATAEPDVAHEPSPTSDEPAKPRRRGWWSLGNK